MIGPYFSGDALAALKALNKVEAADYETLKWVILNRYEITPETYRHWLRAPRLPKGARPHAIVTHLKDAATRWLRPTTDDGHRVIELLVIEQLLTVLPARTHHWLACWKLEHLSNFLEL